MKPRNLRRSAAGALALLTLSGVLTCSLAASPAETPEQLFAAVKELYLQGKYEEGLTKAQRLLELRLADLGEEHADTATAVGAVADFLEKLGRYRESEPLLRKALAARQRLLGAEHHLTAATMDKLANHYSATGRYAEAEPLYLRSLAIREKVLGEEHIQTAGSANNLAVMYDGIGEYDKAKALYERALSIQERVLGVAHPSVANTLSNLAAVHQAKGAYAEAETLYRRATDIVTKAFGEDHPNVARGLNNLGSLYIRIGFHAKAEEVLVTSLAKYQKALGPDHPETTHALTNLARVYFLRKAYARAEPLLERAIGTRERALGATHPLTADALSALGDLQMRMGRYTQAESSQRRALAAHEKAYGIDHQKTAESLRLLGDLQLLQGEHAQAEAALLRALKAAEKAAGPQHQDTALCLESLAALYWATGRPGLALPILQRQQQILARLQDRLLVAGSAARIQSLLENLGSTVAQNASFSLSHPGPESAALGLTSVLQFKARALDVVSDSVDQLRQSLRPEHGRLLAQLADVAGQLSALAFRGAEGLSPDTYQRRTAELEQRQDELETQLTAQSSQFRRQLAAVTLDRVRAAIPEDAALVEWLRYEPFDPKVALAERWGAPRYIAYILKPSGSPVAVDLGPAQALDALVANFRAAVRDPTRNDVQRHAAALSSSLIAPFETHLRGVRHLLVSPDAALNFVPLMALVDRQGRYLATQFEFTHLTSGRDLLRIADDDEQPRGVPVVMADPDYGRKLRRTARPEPISASEQQRSGELDRSGLNFRSLPGTVLEAQAIANLLDDQGTRMLQGRQASEENLKQLHGPQILHVATHGFFLEDRPANGNPATMQSLGFAAENPLLRSGLALAGANARRSGPKDDGILTALEASRLDLQGTQLVVLSACETGLGAARTGEGITGLRRGLLLAGAQTQITSLWRVADAPTKDLMVAFYRELVRGTGRTAALRNAQLAMLASPQHSHPYYWASFITVGDWTPLPKTQ